MYQGTSAKKQIGSADSPPPRWPPGPGFLSVERGRAAKHAQLALPVAPATHQLAPGDIQGNVSRQLAGAVVLGVELNQRRHSRAAGVSAIL
jgi:hypothetical protein